ncbi:hypothetical protein H5410_043581 [Solanum commersonii]|uniref:Inhibitor I9 domain-containing protein n=1 Tax=Solanum commersonii TaxID=4109 RepID=A0A9J5XXJ6_SOLCO|nr:hypothetical protein H5410_043581 [Solanum commersonii]
MPQYRLILTIIGLICVLFPYTTNATEQNNSQIYIVHCAFPDGKRTTRNQDLESYYLSFLPATTSDSSREAPRLIYSYRNVITGFAAKLSLEDLKEMEKMEGFVSARPEGLLDLYTTHSVNFMGLNQNMGFWHDSNYGKGVIIGVIDTGIFPDHPSFSDYGMPHPPAKWKVNLKPQSATTRSLARGTSTTRGMIHGTKMDMVHILLARLLDVSLQVQTFLAMLMAQLWVLHLLLMLPSTTRVMISVVMGATF